VSNWIDVKIVSVDKEKREFTAIRIGDEKVVKIDPCVGCVLPFSFFDNNCLDPIIGGYYSFEGDFFENKEELFLASGFADIINY
jgi:hypothetical protein